MKRLLVLAAIAALPLAASETVVLRNGSTIKATQVERVGELCVLSTEGGRIELDAALVERVEHQDDPAPPVVAAIPPAAPVEVDPRDLVTRAALRYGLPPAIVHALAATESAYRPDAVSPKGAVGVMQLMPGTAQALNANPRDVTENIDAGTHLLRDLLVKYEQDPNPVRRALAAYNAGEGAVAKYNGVPPYRETQAYVEKVLTRYWQQVKEVPATGQGTQ